MKIKDLFKSIISSIKPQDGSTSIKRRYSLDLVDIFIRYEMKLSWYQLKGLFTPDSLNKECTPENLKPFREFLKKRWARIQNIYQLSYTHSYRGRLQVICFAIARKLAEFDNNKVHALKILMPNLRTYNQNLMMDLVEIDDLSVPTEKINLHHFITDHWGNIITINDCLKYASYSLHETVLLHTSAQSELEDTDEKSNAQTLPKVRTLEFRDKIRVSYHSKESAAVIKTIDDMVKENNSLYNAADALENLATYLEKGGMSGGFGGTDKDSGFYSYIGIRKFYDFTKKLTPADFSRLMAAETLNAIYACSVKIIWVNLLTTALFRHECHFNEHELKEISVFIENFYQQETAEEKAQREILCSEQFALKLRDIVELNPFLKTLKQDANMTNKKDLLRALDHNYRYAQERLEQALAKNTLTHFSQIESESFPEPVREALRDQISLETICQRLTLTISELSDMLMILPQDMQSCLILYMGSAHLKSLITMGSQLVEIFQKVDYLLMPQKKLLQKSILAALSKEYLKKIISTERSRIALSKYVTTDIYMEFIPQKPIQPSKFNMALFLNKTLAKQSEEKCHDEKPEIKSLLSMPLKIRSHR